MKIERKERTQFLIILCERDTCRVNECISIRKMSRGHKLELFHLVLQIILLKLFLRHFIRLHRNIASTKQKLSNTNDCENCENRARASPFFFNDTSYCLVSEYKISRDRVRRSTFGQVTSSAAPFLTFGITKSGYARAPHR